MRKPVRVALIGCGSVSQRGLLPHLAMEDGREWVWLEAVCDVVAERAAAAANKYQVPQWFTDLESVLTHADIDAVLIATPVPLHFEQALVAIEAGKHVYLQKTMTSTRAEADRLVEAARGKGVKLVAAPGQMLSPGCRHLKALLADEAIGRFYWAFSNTAFIGHEHEPFRAQSPVDPAWYYKKPGGGPVISMAVYSLHTLTGILGPARRVTAMSGIGLPVRQFEGRQFQVEMDDNTLMLLDFGGARFAVVGGQFAQMGQVIDWGFTGFYGSIGSLEITGRLSDTAFPGRIEVNPPSLAEELGFPHPDYTVEALPYITGPHREYPEAHVYADVRHLADCILFDRDPIPSGEHARHVIEIIEKAYLAAETGQTQVLETRF